MSNFHFLAKDILMIHSSSKTLKIKNKNALLAGAAFCFLLTVSSPVDAQDAARQSQVQAQAEAVAEVQNLDDASKGPSVMAPEEAQLKPADIIDDGPVAVPHSGTYYDSSSFGTSAVGRTAPREVDPAYEPGSRFVVVRKNATAGSFSSQLVAAQRALKLGRYTSALELYEQLYTKNKKNARVLMGLAVAQQKSGFNESALATYDELLRVDPKNADAAVNMIGLIGTQNPQRAQKQLSQMWQKNNRNPAIAAQLGLTSAELGDVNTAIKYLGIASSMEPNNPNHYYNMAVVSDRAGLVKQAIEFYQKSLEIDAVSGARNVSRDVVYDRLAKLRSL